MANKLLLTSPIFFFQCNSMSFFLFSPTIHISSSFFNRTFLDETESNRYREKCNPCFNEKNRCLNNGTCRSLSMEKLTCDCLPAYHGDYCEKLIDACFDNPCKQQGKCQALPDGRFKCHCLPGFTGYRCEINIDDCISHRCLNNGTCIDKINEYSCQCLPLYTGKLIINLFLY